MVARRPPRFKWYVARVTHVVRVRFTVEANYDGWRLDRYLQEKIRRLSRERVQHLIEHRLECEGGRRLKPSTRVVPGLVFSLLRDAEPEPDAPLDFGIVHDDGELLVVDKPAGLPVHPTARYSANTFTSAARLRFPDRKVDPAHRLDRETSGLLACGSAPEWTKRLKRGVRRRRDREDLPRARARGRPPRSASRWTRRSPSPARRRCASACTSRRAGSRPSPSSRCSSAAPPPTARRSRSSPAGRAPGASTRIRAHLHHAGLPLVGDKIYGPDEKIFDRFTRHALTDDDRTLLRLERQALHAWRLELPHPRTGERVRLETPLPPDLAAFWAALRPGLTAVRGHGQRRRVPRRARRPSTAAAFAMRARCFTAST